MNISEAFYRHATATPGRTFLVDRLDREITFGEAAERARGFRYVLDQCGIGRNERVVLTFPNSAEYICAYLGALAHGCIATLVDFSYRPSHLRFVMSDSGASACFGPSSRAGAEGLEHFHALDSWSPAPMDYEPGPPREAESGDALIIYTSGTTGSPKGVRLTHENLDHSMRSIIDWAGFEPDDREYSVLSLTHLFGLAHVHISWTLGGSVVLDDGFSDVPRMLDRMQRFGATSLPATPAGIRLLLDNFSSDFVEAAQGLRRIIINSAPIQEGYVRAILDRLPRLKCFMYYGLTEASRSTWICYNDHPDKLTTVGRPSRGCDLQIDRANSTEAPELPGEDVADGAGEILLRGPHVTPGYWGDVSTQGFRRGWFHTGDLGVIDGNGFVTWMGRLREQINVDGRKVSPSEVEAVLLDHVRVLDCAVVGQADEIYGEVPVAYVVVSGQQQEGLELTLRRFCKGRLERYQIPRHVRLIDAIPRTDSGKTKRLALADRESP